jgi:hypothetical protein
LEKVVASLCLLLTGDILLVHVPFVEEFLQILLDINLALCVYQIGFIDCLLKIKINNITGGENVTDIDILDERLHGLGSLFNLLLAHGAGDLSWATCKSSDEAVGELLVAVSFLEGLNYNSLLSSMSSSKDNYNFSRFYTLRRIRTIMLVQLINSNAAVVSGSLMGQLHSVEENPNKNTTPNSKPSHLVQLIALHVCQLFLPTITH